MKSKSLIAASLLALSVMLAGAQTNPPAARAEALVVIVHTSNPVTNLSLANLRNICVAEQKHWENGRKITVALREPGQPERAAALQTVFRMKENEFDRYFLQSAFVGDVGTAPKQLATANGVRRFVFNVPGAIGFVRVADLDDTVKVVRIDGFAPGDVGYPLRLQPNQANP